MKTKKKTGAPRERSRRTKFDTRLGRIGEALWLLRRAETAVTELVRDTPGEVIDQRGLEDIEFKFACVRNEMFLLLEAM